MRVTVLLLGFLQKMLALAAPTGQIQNVSLSVLLSLSPSKREGGSVLFFYVLIFFFFKQYLGFSKIIFQETCIFSHMEMENTIHFKCFGDIDFSHNLWLSFNN